ncbi:hypothetical protein [Bacteroides bouchesdurhonensis]|uniref:hypothetical protein n=1 Tax=Bacteroides bouchesdurhonensis TaxID=1841855 RepID=UPI00097F8BAF|nr:hypothetical protein [Bacteroides bouchesdurhonensis]
MKKYYFIALSILITSGVFAQKKNFSYKFYGQVRTDLFYNSRANEETVDGLFYMYPKDKIRDDDGNDLNGTANGSFYILYSRLGIDVAGPKLGTAKTSAKVEVDLRGSGSSYSTVRIRHAYFNLDWGTSALLVGQTWHPLFGDVSPQILNLATGAPFQPFNRSPQIRYRYTDRNLQLTGALLWQSQYLSQGPAGKSQAYIKNSCIPEVYVGADYKSENLLAGAGIELLSLKPRTQATGENGHTYKVNERITTLSYEAHVKYINKDWFLGAKTVLGSNLTQASGLGGFGIKSTDDRTGEQKYTPITVSSTWVNAVYGQKWKPGIFIGYAKNLGTSNELEAGSKLYGTGTNLDQLVTAGAELSYNVSNWKFGLEYTLSTAWYGSVEYSSGKIVDTHAVCNNRIVAVAMFQF